MSETSPVTTASNAWRQIVAKYSVPSTRSAVVQICTTVLPFIALIVAMYFLKDVSYWLVLLLAFPAAGMLIRIFIIMHDCGHGSFFPSRKWNDIVGFWTGVLALTPYTQWRREHAIHHATSGNLEERGYGDVATLTVKEYLALSWWGKFKYRLYRNPLVMFGIGPFWLAIGQRLPNFGSKIGKKEAVGVLWTNLALAGLLTLAALLGGFGDTLLIYGPVFFISGAAGIWLFYVQHQFDDTYWRPEGQWDYATAALYGSSYLKLPKVLQWFSGNIGLHHIHHLSPKIPNYRLQRCHDENPVFQQVPTLTFWGSFKTVRNKLWDEDTSRMVGWGQLRRLRTPK